MPTARHRNVHRSPRKLGASRAIHYIVLPSGKGEDTEQKGFFDRPLPGGKTPWDWLQLIGVSSSRGPDIFSSQNPR